MASMISAAVDMDRLPRLERLRRVQLLCGLTDAELDSLLKSPCAIALGNKAGIVRYGFWLLPMDETLALPTDEAVMMWNPPWSLTAVLPLGLLVQPAEVLRAFQSPPARPAFGGGVPVQ